MVKVGYSLSGLDQLRMQANGNRLLLVNNNPAYFSIGLNNQSRYDGFVTNFKGEMIKVIDQIIPEVEANIKAINHKGYKLEIQRNSLVEQFFIPPGFSSLVYSTNTDVAVDLRFDIKGLFDNEKWGRIYKSFELKGRTIIEFHNSQLSLFVAINRGLTQAEKWVEHFYKYDESRGSPPNSRWIYSPGKFHGNLFIISVALSPDEAINENQYIESNLEKLEQNEKSELGSIIKHRGEQSVNIAYNLSRYYLSKLATKTGVIAGLPWFPDVWTRDELISLKAMFSLGKYEFVKQRLLSYTNLVHFDGRLSNHFNGNEKNADSGGWLFKRTLDYYLLSKSLSKPNRFTPKDLMKIEERYSTASVCLEKYFKQDNLLYCKPGETWMDSLKRGGARIEIQALDYSLFELMKLLTKNTNFLRIERKLARDFKRNFFKQGNLWDSAVDNTIRPNLFLAGYISPKLLKDEEWAAAYRKGLKALWNGWGGLSTIDKRDSRFRAYHSGENPESYHNGDSWFFINNLGAIAMARLKGFSKYSEAILKASTEDILLNGSLGCHGEVSSSAELGSKGAWLQAWSLASYIELVEVMRNEKSD